MLVNNLEIEKFDWKLYQKSEDFLQLHINEFLKNNSFAAKISEGISNITGTRLFDWIDHIILPEKVDSSELKHLYYSNLLKIYSSILQYSLGG